MDKNSKETLAQVEKVLKGGRGFVLVGTVDKNDNVTGGLIGHDVSKRMIAVALANGLELSAVGLGLLLVKSSLGGDEESDSKPAKKKVVKKKAVKKTVTKKKTK